MTSKKFHQKKIETVFLGRLPGHLNCYDVCCVFSLYSEPNNSCLLGLYQRNSLKRLCRQQKNVNEKKNDVESFFISFIKTEKTVYFTTTL